MTTPHYEPLDAAVPELTPRDVAFFYSHGFLVKRGILSPELLAALQADAATLQTHYATWRDERDAHYSTARATSFDEMLDGSAARAPAAERVLWRVDQLDRKLPAVRKLKAWSFVRPAMQALLGPDILQYNESFVTKPPRVGMPVHWHQDPSFKIKKTAEPIATMDVYLDHADEENGCIWVLPGSHRLGVLDARALMREHGFLLPGAIPLRMAPGDVAFHDNGCLHGSQANRSERQRRIVYLAFQTLAQARAGGAFTEVQIGERLADFASLCTAATAR